MLGFIAAGLSGILLSLGYAPYSQAWLAWVALAPMAFYFLVRQESRRCSFCVGYFFGLVYFLATLFWLTKVSWFGWLILCAYLSLYPALWTLFWNWRIHPLPRTLSSSEIFRHAFAGALAWVVLEWIRGWMFTGFPWNELGVTQHAVLPVIQIADLGGVPLISFVLMFSNLVFALHARRVQFELKGIQPLSARWDLIVVLLVMGGCFTYGVQRIYQSYPLKANLRFLSIQPSIPQDPWKGAPVIEALNKMEELTIAGIERASEPIDLILWPEPPIAAGVLEHPAFNAIAQCIVQEKGYSLLAGSDDYRFDKVYNSAMLLQNDTAQVYHKRHLVPMGEYVPFAKIFPFLRRFTPPGIDFSPGEKPEIFQLASPPIKIAPLVCFEDTLSYLARDMNADRPDLLVDITNDGWFGSSPAAQQHLDNAIFRTVEYRLPLLRATNNGITAAVTEKGIPLKLVKHPETPDVHRAGYFLSELPVRSIPDLTFYARFGNWLPIFGLIFLSASFAAGWRKKKASQ